MLSGQVAWRHWAKLSGERPSCIPHNPDIVYRRNMTAEEIRSGQPTFSKNEWHGYFDFVNSGRVPLGVAERFVIPDDFEMPPPEVLALDPPPLVRDVHGEVIKCANGDAISPPRKSAAAAAASQAMDASAAPGSTTNATPIAPVQGASSDPAAGPASTTENGSEQESKSQGKAAAAFALGSIPGVSPWEAAAPHGSPRRKEAEENERIALLGHLDALDGGKAE